MSRQAAFSDSTLKLPKYQYEVLSLLDAQSDADLVQTGSKVISTSSSDLTNRLPA